MARHGENIFKRKDGRWEARYVKEIALDGTKKYGSVYAKTYREVKIKRQALIIEPRRSDKHVDLTVGRIMDEWLCESKNQLKISTRQKYEGIVKNHISVLLGTFQVRLLTRQIIVEFTDKLLSESLSRESVNQVLITLGTALGYAGEKYKIATPDVHLLKTSKSRIRVLSDAEQQVLVQRLLSQNDVYSFGILLALYTGLRIGELCALRWEDISKNTIHVRGTMQRLKNADGATEVMILTPKTESSDRLIPIPFALRSLLEQNRRTSGYVLTKKDGKFVEPRLLQQKFSARLAECNISGATFHTLRHTFATRCIEAGVDVKTLSELLGHADVKTTLNRYVHSSFELKQRSMDKLLLTG